MSVIILIVSIILMTCLSPAQWISSSSGDDVVFGSGFEEGSKAIWDDFDGNPDEQNQILVDRSYHRKVVLC